MTEHTTYKHRGQWVTVRTDFKGRDQEYCLCYECKLFHPNMPTNCGLAQELHEFCRNSGMTAPVWECSKFESTDEDNA